MKLRVSIARSLRRLANIFEAAVWRQGRSYLQQATQGARFDINFSSRTELMRKSRYFEQNNWLLNRLADVFECYTVGTGLQVQPATGDAAWNEKAKDWWDGWELYPDLTSRQTLGTLESLMTRAWFVDGEVFIVLTRGESGKPRLQIIEAHRVKTPPEYADDPRVIDGIRVDGLGRPVAYYIGSEDKAGQVTFGRPTPADYVIHLFEPGRPGQMRGLPFAYSVLNDLHDLDDLSILEMKAARSAARMAQIIKTESGELNAEEFVRNGGVQSTDTTGRVDYIKQSLGDETVVLKTGETYEQFPSNRPSVVTMEYWAKIEEKVCSGIGIPHVLACPDSIQGTVYRGTLDMADAWFRARSCVVQDAVRRIYGYVMSWAIYNVPELTDPPEDWREVIIHPPRSVNVDVGRNAAATLAELAAGATSYDLIYGPRGLDWREQFDALAEQQRYAKSIGLDLTVGQIVSEPAAPRGTPTAPDHDSQPVEVD